MLHSNGLPLKLKGLFNPKKQLSPYDFEQPGQLDANMDTKESRLRQGLYPYPDFRNFM